MPTQAMLVIFAGVGDADLAEFNLWYDREHLADRVNVPGFLSARRYQGEAGAWWQWLAIYEVADLDVFDTAAYREKLAKQSDWSRRVLPSFIDPQRSVAKVIASVGSGFAAVTAVWRIRGAVAEAKDKFFSLADAAMGSSGDITAMRLLACDPKLSKPVAEYPPARRSPVAPDDLLLFADAVSIDGLVAVEGVVGALPGEKLALGRWRFRNSMMCER